METRVSSNPINDIFAEPKFTSPIVSESVGFAGGNLDSLEFVGCAVGGIGVH